MSSTEEEETSVVETTEEEESEEYAGEEEEEEEEDDDDDAIVPPQGEVHGTKKNLANIPAQPKLKTVHDIFMYACETFPDEDYLGTPREEGTGENMKVVYDFKTYAQILDLVKAFGAGLEKVDAGEFIGLYSLNREEWVIAEKACHAYSRVTVPLYDTLGPEAVEYSLNLADVSTVVCEARLVKNMMDIDCDELTNIIYMKDTAGEITDEIREAAEVNDLNLFAFEDIIKMGKKNKKLMGKKWGNFPSGDDLFTLCFTSGTTGNPKGAMLSHTNVLAQIGSIDEVGVKLLANDYHLSYLPLAHVFERMMQVAMTMAGGKIGFYRGDTKLLLADIAALRPTIFASVPRLLNKIYTNVIAGVTAAGGCKKSIFDAGVKKKTANLHKDNNPTHLHKFYDKLAFVKTKAALGGRVRIMVTGSAPLSAEVMDFCRIAFGAIVLEGYGQTECAATCTITRVDDYSTGHVGNVIPCCQIALANVASMNWFATKKGAAKAKKDWEKKGKKGPEPREGGEICIKGTNVFQGYFKNDEKTAEAIDEDGWLHTGDIGIWLPGGQLKIVDRKKNIFKLAQGEYVAPENVENQLKLSPFVAMIWVHGNSLQSSTVAVVVPNEAAAAAWAKANGKEGQKLKKLCKDKAFKQAVMDNFNEIGAEKDAKGKARLVRYEIPADLHLEAEEWVPGEDLTPSFKLKRKNLEARYEGEVDAMYEILEANQKTRDAAGAGKKGKKKGKK